MFKYITLVLLMSFSMAALAVQKVSDTYPYVNFDISLKEKGRLELDYNRHHFIDVDSVQFCNDYRTAVTEVMMTRQAIHPEDKGKRRLKKSDIRKQIEEELQEVYTYYGKNSVIRNYVVHFHQIWMLAYDEYPYMENNSNREKMVVSEAFGEHFYKYCVHREDELRYLLILGETKDGRASPIAELIVKNNELRDRHNLKKHEPDSSFDSETTLKVIGTLLDIVRWANGIP